MTILWVSLQIASFLNLGRKSESPCNSQTLAFAQFAHVHIYSLKSASNSRRRRGLCRRLKKCANEEPLQNAQKCTEHINRINIPSEVAFSTDLGKSARSVCDCGSKKTLWRYNRYNLIQPKASRFIGAHCGVEGWPFIEFSRPAAMHIASPLHSPLATTIELSLAPRPKAAHGSSWNTASGFRAVC